MDICQFSILSNLQKMWEQRWAACIAWRCMQLCTVAKKWNRQLRQWTWILFFGNIGSDVFEEGDLGLDPRPVFLNNWVAAHWQPLSFYSIVYPNGTIDSFQSYTVQEDARIPSGRVVWNPFSRPRFPWYIHLLRLPWRILVFLTSVWYAEDCDPPSLKENNRVITALTVCAQSAASCCCGEMVPDDYEGVVSPVSYKKYMYLVHRGNHVYNVGADEIIFSAVPKVPLFLPSKCNVFAEYCHPRMSRSISLANLKAFMYIGNEILDSTFVWAWLNQSLTQEELCSVVFDEHYELMVVVSMHVQGRAKMDSLVLTSREYLRVEKEKVTICAVDTTESLHFSFNS